MIILEESWLFALKHLEKFGETDVFPKYCEVYSQLVYCFQHSDKFEIIELLNSVSFSQPCLDKIICLVPTSKNSFQKYDILDPLMTILYTAWVYQIGEVIEKSRHPEDIVFSYRFVKNDPEYRFFKKDVTVFKFQTASMELAANGTYKYVVMVILHNFYNQVCLRHLQNALKVLKIDKNQTKDLESYLSKLNSNQSHALPIGSAASKLLAEVILHRFDVAMLTHVSARNAKYIRFVDDVRIFVHTFEDGLSLLEHLHEVIYVSNGLALQSIKTKIITVEEYIQEMKYSFEGVQVVYDKVKDEISNYSTVDWLFINVEENELDLKRLFELLKQNISKNEPSSFVISSCLGIFGKFKSTLIVDYILDNIINFVRFAKEVFEYFAEIADKLDEKRRRQIIDRLFSMFSKYPTSFTYFWIFFFDMIAENPILWKFNEIADQYTLPQNKIIPGTILELYFCKMIAALGTNGVYLATMCDKFSNLSKFTQRALINSVGNMKTESNRFMLELLKEKSQNEKLNLQMLEFASGAISMLKSIENPIFDGLSFCLIGDRAGPLSSIIKSLGGRVKEFKQDCICVVDAQDLPTCLNNPKYSSITACTIISVEYIVECKTKKTLIDLSKSNIADKINTILQSTDETEKLQMKKDIKSQFIE